MVASWKKKDEEINRILRVVDDNVKFNPDGSVSMDDYLVFSRYFPVLNSYLSTSHTIASTEQSRILEAALYECKKCESFDAATVLSAVRRDVQNILRRKSIVYYLSTTMSILRVSLPSVYIKTVDEANIRFCRDFPKKIEAEKWFLNGFGHVNSSQPSHYARVLYRVGAKTPVQAADQALRSLDLLAAPINFMKNLDTTSLLRSGQLRPYNAVRVGPYQVLHTADGKIYNQRVWYDPNYYEERSPKAFEDGRQDLRRFLNMLLGKLRHHPLRQVMSSSLRHYNEALNLADRHMMLARLWMTLEAMVGDPRDAKTTIKRAAFLFDDREYVQMQLDYIANARNKYVHRGSEERYIEMLIESLRNYVEQLLKYMPFSRVKFANHGEFVGMLDMPWDRNQIEYRIKIGRKALAFLRS